MRQALANAAKTGASNAAPATGGVPGGVIGSVPSTVQPPTSPPEARPAGANAVPALTFTTIETIAGKDWKFDVEGIDAIRAPLGKSYGVAQDKSGNIYATDISNQAVVKIDAPGRVHILAGPDSAPEKRPNSPLGVAVDPSGSVYFTESYRLRKILPNGDVVTVAGADKSGFSPDGAVAATSPVSSVQGLAFAKDGTVVFVELGNNRVRRIDAQGRLQTVAGDGQGRFGGDGGPAGSASLAHPSGITYDAQGNLLIADQNNGRVRRVAPDGKIMTIIGPGVTKDVPGCPTGVATNSKSEIFVADPCKREIFVLHNGELSVYGGTGTGLKEPSGQGSRATGASFDEWALAVNDKDELLISGPDFGHIYRIDRNGIFSILAGAGNWRAAADGTPAREAYFQRPNSLVVDAKGAIFFSDSSAHRIYRIDEKRMVTKLAGTGRSIYGGEAVVARDSGITGPLGLRVRLNGAVVYIERGSSRIREIAPDGRLQTLAGNGRAEYAGDGGPAKSAALNGPGALALDAAGNIYFSDSNNNRIRKIKTDGTIQLVAGDGTRGFSGDGGPAERASLNTPLGIEIGPDGNLYVADAGNRRIRRISNGTITTIAGDGSNRFAGDMGPAPQASFMWPYALAFGPDRALYVLDTTASRVRRIDPQSGIVTTVAGTGSHAVSGDGGPVLQAGLGAPEGLAFDSAGNLYLAETSGKIRMIHAALRPAANTPPSNGPASGGGIGAAGAGVYRVGGGVSSPGLVHKVEPDYSEQARNAKLQGTVLLYAEVTPEGRASNIKVARSLGLGLDEKAIEAVKQWVFKPGYKDGKPVTVEATIEVNFRFAPEAPLQNQAASVPVGAAPPQFTPSLATGPSQDAIISVSADRMETFLREKIGVWTTEEARTVLGTARTENGKELTFETPGTNFSRVTLAFDSAGKLDRVNFTPARIVRWARQLAFMKGKYPADEFKAGQSGDSTLYTFASSRTSFTVLPDGTIVSMTIF